MFVLPPYESLHLRWFISGHVCDFIITVPVGASTDMEAMGRFILQNRGRLTPMLVALNRSSLAEQALQAWLHTVFCMFLACASAYLDMHWNALVHILVHCLDSGFAPTLKNTVSSTKFTDEIRRWLPQTPQVSVGPRSLRRFCVTWATRRCVVFSACLCTVSAAKLFMFITSCKLDSRFAV